ncbi:hypothetical protein WJ542_19770 [Paraburkholderia sp. B3]|uniref:hypothetical protein n=1 Tax=Paraburkholderia sp. B3 TaxID=3134791 RepID=UPI003982AA91
MQTLPIRQTVKAVSKSAFQSIASPLAKAPARASRHAAAARVSVQMVVRVAPRDAETARRALHRMLGSALGIHTIDIDRRRDLACLHIELERTRVSEAMAVLIRTVTSAEFGTIRLLERP